jgi:hypothetical protein
VSQFWPSTPGGAPPTTPPPRLPAPAPSPPAPHLPPRQPRRPGADATRAPAPGGRGPSRDARNALVIAAAVVATILVFAALFTVLIDGDDGRESAATTVPATVAPTTPPTLPPPTTAPPPSSTVPPLPPPETALDLQAFVAEQRGHAFTADVPIVFLSEDEWGDQLIAAIGEEALEQQLWELQTLGIIGTGPDAIEELKELLADGLIGYYEAGQILIRGEGRSDGVDVTLVHELTHALDDQTFGLNRPELFDTQDESPFGFAATVEGSAMNIETAFAASRGIPYLPLEDSELTGALLASPKYVFGESYVRSLLDSGGIPRLDESFRLPPVTSKQVMQRELHLPGYTPVPVEPPPADGDIVDEGLFGQVRFWQMFVQVLPADEAEVLAADWAGDWHVVWIDGLEQCIRVDVHTATAQSASDFAEVLRAWSVAQDHAVVEELSSGLIRLTTCAPRPPPPPGGGISPA